MKKWKQMNNIIIADDHQMIADGIESFILEIASIGEIVKVSSGKELLQKIDFVNPSLVISDLEMPDLNGFEACTEIRKTHPDIKIIVLSMHKDYGLIKKLIDLGVDGYVSKNSDKEDIVLAVDTVLKGKKYFTSDVIMALAEKKTIQGGRASDFEKISLLSDRERDIVKLVCEGYSNKEIAAKLFISHRTVDTHRTNIMNKLEIKNVVQLTRFALKNGLCT